MSERDNLIRKFAVHALTRPGNVLPGVAVAATGLALSFWPLYPLAALVYLGLTATTLFNKNEAKKVLERQRQESEKPAKATALDEPYVRERYERVATEEARIRGVLKRSTVELPEVRAELTGLMEDVGVQCRRAQSVVAYLRTVDPAEQDRAFADATAALRDASEDLRPTIQGTVSALGEQIKTTRMMQAELERFDAQMTQVVSSLGSIRAQVARLEVDAQPDASARIREQVTAARAYLQEVAQTGER